MPEFILLNSSRLRAACLLLCAFVIYQPPVAAAFTAFESGHVRPLALSASGDRLFAVNTPDNHLEIFDIILEGIGNSRTASEQYTALSAAERMVTGLEAAERKKLKDVIEDQRSGGPGKWITIDSDRWGLSERILSRL